MEKVVRQSARAPRKMVTVPDRQKPATAGSSRLAWEAAPIKALERAASLRTQFDAFHIDALVTPVATRDFEGSVRAVRRGELLLLTIKGNAIRLRDRMAAGAADGSAFVALYVSSGGETLCQDRGADSAKASDGDLIVRSVSGRGEVHFEGGGQIVCLVLPWTKPSLSLPPGGAVIGREAAGPLCSLLWSLIASLTDSLNLPSTDISTTTEVICGLIQLAFDNPLKDDDRPRFRFSEWASYSAQIEPYLLENFANPFLTPKMMADDFGISVRYLSKLMQDDETTFRKRLTDIRLKACRNFLADPLNRTINVAEIAFNCGFNDLSQFNRQFKLSYSTTPTRLRAEIVKSAGR